MTLGELLNRVEGSEAAHAENMKTADRIAQRSSIEAAHFRMCAGAIQFQPWEPAMPGISRLEAFADREWGSGLTPESVRRMRGLVCAKGGLSLDAANALTLNKAADMLLGVPLTAGDPPQAAPRDRVAAYLADVRAVEDGWVQRAGGMQTHTLGTSPWDVFEPRLNEIKRRHGFAPDNALVRSVTAYLDERSRIQSEREAERREREWPLPEGHPHFEAQFRLEIRYDVRLDNCRARHFPRLNTDGSDIRTPADLWAYINWCVCPVRMLVGAGPRERPAICPEDLERVYGTLHQLQQPGAPHPPYPSLTPAEAEHELRRISTVLERVDRETYDRVLAQEEACMASGVDAVPALADLIAFHRAWEVDPRTGGTGILTLPVQGPAGIPPVTVRSHADRLTPVARSLQTADIRYQTEDMASQRGFCAVGDFTSRTAEAIKARLIGIRGISSVEADAMPLADVLTFLSGLPSAAPPEATTEVDRWLTVTKAAKAAGVEVWKITRAADQGELKTNGKARNERRIDKISLVDWQLRRAEHPEPEETEAQAQAAMKRADRSARN
jgi:hypothetical protein